MSTKEIVERASTVGGVKPTLNFRWLVKKSGGRVLQQLFINKRYPLGAAMDLGLYEWRDVPEVTEE